MGIPGASGGFPELYMCIVHCVLCIVYCALCTVHCILCIVYCAVCIVLCILCIVYCALSLAVWVPGAGLGLGLPGPVSGKPVCPEICKNCFDETVTKLILEGLGALGPRPPKNPVIKPVGEEGADLSANGK